MRRSPHQAVDDLVPLAQVQQLVLERCAPLGSVELPLGAALGHVLSADVLVRDDVPPFANSAMDGYAVRAADTSTAPSELAVVGIIAAGSAPERGVGPGETLQIMTGAPMPDGADSVAIVERCERIDDGRVRVLDAVEPGAHIRLPGSDMRAGSTAVRGGTVLAPAHLGVLASVGQGLVSVGRRPRVGVMSTGDELADPGAPLLPGQIRDSNRVALLGVVERDGFEPVDLGVVADTEADVSAAFQRALSSCDAVLSSGGVSKGEFDFVKVVLDQLAEKDAAESFELTVAIRPAKPLALAWLQRPGGAPGDRVAFFGLPGNPVSALVSYQVIALPGLRRMSGHPTPVAAPVRAVAGEAFRRRPDGRLHLLRAELTSTPDGHLSVRSAGGQSSHQLSAMAASNALALVPDGDGYEAGDVLEVLPLGAATAPPP